jgi:hypothetical protein
LPLSLARCLSIGLVVLSGIVQRAELVGECVLKIRQRILHPGRGGDLCHPCLVLRDPQELRDTTLVVAGEGERIWNSVSDLHLRMIRRRRAVEKGGNETLPYASSHLVLDRCRKPFVDGSVSLRAIGWMGHAACSLWGLEWNAVLGMLIDDWQRTS